MTADNSFFYNTDEVVNKFINELRFDIIYKENLFPLAISETSKLPYLNSFKVLYSSAITGIKTIAFYHRIPYIEKIFFIKSPFLIISRELPDRIQLPVIFLKDIKLLAKYLTISYKLSSETKLPVNLVISPSVLNNFTKDTELHLEHTILKPYLSIQDLNPSNKEELLEHFQLAETLLSQEIETQSISNTLSFYNNNYDFLPYIIPHIKNRYLTKLENMKEIKIFNDESYFFENLQLNFKLKFQLYIQPTKKNISVKHLLCPGCPFVTLKRLFTKDIFIFTNIKCDMISNLFKIKQLSFSEYYGLTIKPLQKDTLFIGNISEINHNLLNNLKRHQKVILLLDIDDKGNISLPKIKKIKKLPESNFIFPYSCENIPNQKHLLVREKKCKCILSKQSPICIVETYCPALYETENKTISINESLCLGCGYCKEYCPYGAIK